ncbi:putative quinol monooxygenase [Nocardioides sp. 1609]|uniref:putative quinol monooxygenase n=1 Tax=Nocardioides sp. 1609 TaxID=2508327 RepID=UPI00106F1662|nr:putative quinol monooxygenase [Nocardioides sp. 1609]
MVVVTGRIQLKIGEIGALRTAAKTMMVDTLAESGCLEYQFSFDMNEPAVLRLFEHWESDEALEFHFSSTHFATFAEVLVQSADGPADFVRYQVDSARPLFG